MNQVITFGVDLAKHVFQAHGVDAQVEELKLWMNLKNRPFGGIPRARAISSQV